MGMMADHAQASDETALPGLASREAAARAIETTLGARIQLDDALAKETLLLDARDASLARAIAVTAFRHYGTLHRALDARLERGLASLPRPAQAILLAAAAQIVHLDAADHAAVDLAVTQVRGLPQGMRFAGLANAVLRRLSEQAGTLRAQAETDGITLPQWLDETLEVCWGVDALAAMRRIMAHESALDITVRGDAERWAALLDAELLPTGSLRLRGRTPVHELSGYDSGAWWVQDASAAIPVRLLGDVAGLRVADLCAAPGGKTLQLAAAGAQVTAVDRSAPRLQRLVANLARVGLSADIRASDAASFTAAPFDAVLLDAPCTATGTIRRHPDIAWTKTPADQGKLAALQGRLLDQAVNLTRPGGRLVFCTCSLQPEEGEDQIASLLARRGDVRLVPIRAGEIGVPEAVTPEGFFRALPHQLPGPTPRMSGWGGFFAARLERRLPEAR
jgi:16S rRNA (cytosine967-C5)-methyltransferase